MPGVWDTGQHGNAMNELNVIIFKTICQIYVTQYLVICKFFNMYLM